MAQPSPARPRVPGTLQCADVQTMNAAAGRAPHHAASPAPGAHRQRTWRDALFDACLDAVAAGLCLWAWVAPQSVQRMDLLALAAPLFFIQVPLSLLTLGAGVTRLSDRQMSRRIKLAFVLGPSVAMALIAPMFLGTPALIGVVLLSIGSLWRIASGRVDIEAPIKGAFVTYERSGTSIGIRVGDSGSSGGLSSNATSLGDDTPVITRWRVQMGHSQVMASLTLGGCFVLLSLLPFVDVAPFAVTTQIHAASGWAHSTLGAVIPAHYALAAGVALFCGRLLMQFEGISPSAGSPGAEQTPTPENDPVLREIMRKVDGGKQRPGKRRGR